jgi:ABC-type uncharacterized transport system substrate-binding protein
MAMITAAAESRRLTCDRVVRGETIASIPFEKYSKATFGINMEVAKEIGIAVAPDLLSGYFRP